MIQTPSPEAVVRSAQLFAKHFLKIQDKSMQTVPLVYNPIQSDYLINRTPRDLILKPRQVGFTTLIQGELFRYTTTRPASAITLGKDSDNTTEIRRIWKHYYDQLPEGFKPVRLYDNVTLTTFPEVGSRAVIGTAGSMDVGRGGTRTHFHGSEVAFWTDAQKIINGALQAGNLKWVVMESTANGQQGWFYNACMDALQSKGVWKLHFYTWFDEPTYQTALTPDEVLDYTEDELTLIAKHGLTPEQIKWRRGKIDEIGTLADFLQEYPEDPLTCFKKSGVGYFGDVPDSVYSAPFGVAWDSSHTYAAGLDFGQQQDYTVLIVIDLNTGCMVDMVRVNQEQWSSMREAIRNCCKKWSVDLLLAESNSMGRSQIEEMRAEFYEADLLTTIVGFETTAVTKPPLMATYRTALREKGLKLQGYDIIKHEIGAAVSKQTQKGWTVESPRDNKGHGDTIIAGALAYLAATRLGIEL